MHISAKIAIWSNSSSIKSIFEKQSKRTKYHEWSTSFAVFV